MQKSFVQVFRKFGNKSGMCGQWSYNLALNYCRVLKKYSGSVPGSKLAAGGNANQSSYHNNLVAMGYSYKKVLSGQPWSKIDSTIKNTNWGYGDVVVYWATDRPTSGSNSHHKYGHTQIYVGEINKNVKGPNGFKGKGWATSTSNNYGTVTCYSSRKSSKWTLIVLRAPAQASQVKSTKRGGKTVL